MRVTADRAVDHWVFLQCRSTSRSTGWDTQFSGLFLSSGCSTERSTVSLALPYAFCSIFNRSICRSTEIFSWISRSTWWSTETCVWSLVVSWFSSLPSYISLPSLKELVLEFQSIEPRTLPSLANSAWENVWSQNLDSPRSYIDMSLDTLFFVDFGVEGIGLMAILFSFQVNI